MLAKCDPGIRDTVAWLRSLGFNTTDSGDGKTKRRIIDAGYALPEPHVFMVVSPRHAIDDARRLWSFAKGIAGTRVELHYNPDDECRNPDVLRGGAGEAHMKVIYVAAPFTAASGREIEMHIRRAEDIGYEIAKLGAAALVPHSIGRFMIGTFTPQYWYDATAALLLKCDAGIFMHGWSGSHGCQGEHALAVAQGIPCFYSIPDLRRWLQEMLP